jgi:hypothetical protein
LSYNPIIWLPMWIIISFFWTFITISCSTRILSGINSCITFKILFIKKKTDFFLCKIYYFLTWLAVNKFLFRLRTRQFKYDLKLSVNRYWGSLDPASVTGIILLKINIKKNNRNINMTFIRCCLSISKCITTCILKYKCTISINIITWMLICPIWNIRLEYQKMFFIFYITIELVILI